METRVPSANLAAVQNIYNCFTSGDLPGLLNTVADDVDWRHNGDPDIIPFSRPYRGKAGVAEFFKQVGQTIRVIQFQPSNFKVSDSEVTNDIYVEAEVLATGKTYQAKVKYHFSFDENGKVKEWHSEGDMSAAEAAFRK